MIKFLLKSRKTLIGKGFVINTRFSNHILLKWSLFPYIFSVSIFSLLWHNVYTCSLWYFPFNILFTLFKGCWQCIADSSIRFRKIIHVLRNLVASFSSGYWQIAFNIDFTIGGCIKRNPLPHQQNINDFLVRFTLILHNLLDFRYNIIINSQFVAK